MKLPQTIGSLFSGIGLFELGLEWAGLGETLWQVEIDPYCRQVLAKHWPGAKRYEDIQTVSGRDLARVDLICGGFPCQDVSSAGKGAGLSGARSGLWYEFARIIDEHRPAFVIVENVASGARRWVDAVRVDLGRQGYQSIPIPISAYDVGAPHLRERIFIVAYAEREPLRDEQQRGPARRPGAVRDEGQGIPLDAGVQREVARADTPSRRLIPGAFESFSRYPGASAHAARLTPGGLTEPTGVSRVADSHGAGCDQRAGSVEECRGRTELADSDRRAGALAHADHDRQSALAFHGEMAELRRMAGDPSPWAFAPEFRGVDDGSAIRLDGCDPERRRRFRRIPWANKRLKALGNGVVPQCAEVIGHVIRALCETDSQP